MFTQWSQVEEWIRDNGLNSWRFLYDRTGVSTDSDGNSSQVRSNRVAIMSDAFPGELEEKIALTRRRLMNEKNVCLYGYGKRGKENTGMLYCEVRLVDEVQQPSTQAVSSPAIPYPNEEQIAARVRREVQLEFENQMYLKERKQFEEDKKQFEAEKQSAIGMLVHHLSPLFSAMGQKRVAGVDADAPVHAQPIHAVQEEDAGEVLFEDEESDKLFDLMARFKAVEPRYLELLENVVKMAESGDSMYNTAKMVLLK